MATTSYLDIGAKQRQEGGGDSATRGYLDIGAVQREEAAPVTSTTGVMTPRSSWWGDL